MKALIKVLIVVTSHGQLGETGKPTGYYLPEVSHPALVFAQSGIDFDIASPEGGLAPLDETSRDLSDPANREFLANPNYRAKLENTLRAKDVDPSGYDAILYAGGHGTMWDFPHDEALAKIAGTIYERGGVVAAVCHGPAALLNIRLLNNQLLITGKKLTGFSNDEEEAAGLTSVMPFLLESALVEKGALYDKAGLWQKNVVVDGRLVTGQNPASASGVGEAIARLLKAKSVEQSQEI